MAQLIERNYGQAISNRKQVFVAYTESQEFWVEQSIKNHLETNDLHVTLLHQDLLPGRNKFQFLDQHVANEHMPIIVVISSDFEECELCQYLCANCLPLQTLKQGKIIPILLERGKLPSCLQSVSCMSQKNWKVERLFKALKMFFQESQQAEADIEIQPVLKDYILRITEMPQSPILACDNKRHWNMIRWNNRIAVEVINVTDMDNKNISFLKVCVEYIHVYPYIDGQRQECVTNLEEYVKILPEKHESATEDTQTDFVFIVRCRHSSGMDHLDLDICFSLYGASSSEKCWSKITECKVVSLVTKKSRSHSSKTKKKKYRTMSYEGDNESGNDVGIGTSSHGIISNEWNDKTHNSSTEKVHYSNNGKEQVHIRDNSGHIKDQGHTKDYEIYRTHEEHSLNGGKSQGWLREPQQRVISKGVLKQKSCREMLSKLEEIADNQTDQFKQFFKEGNGCMEKLSNEHRWDEYVLVVIKMCGVEHYQGHMKGCKKYLELAEKHLPKCHMYQLLKGRMLYYISAMYREKKLFNKADNAIKESLQLLSSVECGEDTAKAYFNQGKLYMVMLESSMPRTHSCYKKNAVEAFKKALDHFHKDDVIDQKQIRRCLLNIARVLVGCPMSKAKSGQLPSTIAELKGDTLEAICVSQSHITEATTHIEEIRKRLTPSGDPPKKSLRNLMQICQSEAEIFYMEALANFNTKNKFNDSILLCNDKLHEALTIAKAGLYKEEKGIQSFISVVATVIPKNSVIKDKKTQELQCLSDVDVTDVSSVDEDQGSSVLTSGLEDLFDRTNSSAEDSDRK